MPTKNNTHYIIGNHCLQEVWKHAPERFLKVHTSKKEDLLLDEIKKKKVPVNLVSKKQLYDLVGTESHQGVVVEVKKPPYYELKVFLEKVASKDRSIVLVMDSLYDPQNFGALLRAAECFGVDGVVWSKNRGSDINPVVTKASVGASEIVPLMKVSNLVETLKKFQKEGYWVVTTELCEEAQSLFSFEFPEKTVLVVGSEGKGVRSLISRHADYKIAIPMKGKIDSLNVSQATAIFLAMSIRGEK